MMGELETAMRFAACSDSPEAVDEAWQTLHDALIVAFPYQRRSAVRANIYGKDEGIKLLDRLRSIEVRDDAELRSKVGELGLLVVVMVDVEMSRS